MSDNPELSVEARLIDYISANLNTITRNIQQFESTAGGAFQTVSGKATETQGVIGQLGNEISNNLFGSVRQLITGFVGLGSAMVVVDKMKEAYKLAKELQVANVQLNAAIGFYSSALHEQSIELSEKHTMDQKDIVIA